MMAEQYGELGGRVEISGWANMLKRETSALARRGSWGSSYDSLAEGIVSAGYEFILVPEPDLGVWVAARFGKMRLVVLALGVKPPSNCDDGDTEDFRGSPNFYRRTIFSFCHRCIPYREEYRASICRV